MDLSKVDGMLPPELQGANNADILDHYRGQLRDATVVSRRCRLMLLGNGGVGKTTLARRLVTGSPDAQLVPDTHVTHGALLRKRNPSNIHKNHNPVRTCQQPQAKSQMSSHLTRLSLVVASPQSWCCAVTHILLRSLEGDPRASDLRSIRRTSGGVHHGLWWPGASRALPSLPSWEQCGFALSMS